MGKAPERKEKGKETLQSLINTKGNKNKSWEHLLPALDGRIRLKLSAFPVWVYVWRRPVWPLPMRKEKLFTFPNLGCARNWFLFVSIAEMKIQRGKKSLIWIQLNLGLFPRQNESSALRRAVSNRVFCFSWNVSTCSTGEESCEMQGLVHQTQLGKAEVSSFYKGYSWFGEYLQHETNLLTLLAVSGCLRTPCCAPRHSWGPGCCLGWLVRECPVSPTDSVPAWSNPEGWAGMGLLHPSHWCFSAWSEQGCVLARLLAQKPGGCWTLNKVSEGHRNHSVLMHLITHTAF